MFVVKGAMYPPNALIVVIIAFDFPDCGKYYGVLTFSIWAAVGNPFIISASRYL